MVLKFPLSLPRYTPLQEGGEVEENKCDNAPSTSLANGLVVLTYRAIFIFSVVWILATALITLITVHWLQIPACQSSISAIRAGEFGTSARTSFAILRSDDPQSLQKTPPGSRTSVSPSPQHSISLQCHHGSFARTFGSTLASPVPRWIVIGTIYSTTSTSTSPSKKRGVHGGRTTRSTGVMKLLDITESGAYSQSSSAPWYMPLN